MIEDLIKRHFEATIGRGLITDKTKVSEFIAKMMEEDSEMFAEMIHYIKGPANEKEMIQEAWDSVMVRLNFLQKLGVDLELSLLKNVQTQENRVIELKKESHGNGNEILIWSMKRNIYVEKTTHSWLTGFKISIDKNHIYISGGVLLNQNNQEISIPYKTTYTMKNKSVYVYYYKEVLFEKALPLGVVPLYHIEMDESENIKVTDLRGKVNA